jgi:hypothetical protein
MSATDSASSLIEGNQRLALLEKRPRPRATQISHGQVTERRRGVNSLHQKPPKGDQCFLAPKAITSKRFFKGLNMATRFFELRS